MKTNYEVINDDVNIKIVQVNLRDVGNYSKEQLSDHIASYLEDKFPNYAYASTIDSANFPESIIVKLERTTGLGGI